MGIKMIKEATKIRTLEIIGYPLTSGTPTIPTERIIQALRGHVVGQPELAII